MGLILGELSCWTVFGTAQHDLPLMVLGVTGITSAVLMLRRVTRERGWRFSMG